MDDSILEKLLDLLFDNENSQVSNIEHTSEGVRAVITDSFDGSKYYLSIDKQIGKEC